jgi:hypothetical protein
MATTHVPQRSLYIGSLMQITGNSNHSLHSLSMKEQLFKSQAGTQLKIKLGLHLIILSEGVWGKAGKFTHNFISSLDIDT